MKIKILVVDNNPVMLKFMSDFLGRKGHEVLTADGGISAMEILKSYTPDVMFVDLIMPHIDGEKLCRIVRKMPALRDVCLIILSAIAADQEVDYLEFGADACIAKGPFDQMARNIRAVLEQIEQNNSRSLQGAPLGLDHLQPRQITRELLSIKHRLETILESMADGILELTRDGIIVGANPAALALFGLPEERLLSARLTELFFGQDREIIRDLISASTGVRSIPEDRPLTLRGRQFVVKILPVRNSSGELIVMITDVSERLRMEAQIRYAEKMEAIGLLAGGIAHDFNNVLTAILGNISLARLHINPGDRSYEKLTEAERGVFRARDLTHQLLPFSPGGAPVRKVVSIETTVRKTCLAVVEGSLVGCDVSIQDDLWPVEADLLQIRQVVSNLTVNALQATPTDGKIELSAENVTVTEEGTAPLTPGRYVRISIRDSGDGIPEEHLGRIFDPYFTTKETGKGLGLASAYSIVHKHKGCITAESEKGRGTIFRIFLPATEKESPWAEANEEQIHEGRGNILVMDDEEQVRKVVGEMLACLGYQTVFAADGDEAIRLYMDAAESGGSFDAVILDLTVPGGMGGKETIKVLLRIDPKVKAIVSSGYSNDPIMSVYGESGFLGVLEKPYRLNELSEVLHRVVTGDGC